MGTYKQKMNLYFHRKQHFLDCVIYTLQHFIYLSYLDSNSQLLLSLDPKPVLKAFAMFSSWCRLSTEAYKSEVVWPESLIKFNQGPGSPYYPLCALVSGGCVKCLVTLVYIVCQIQRLFVTILKRKNSLSISLAS